MALLSKLAVAQNSQLTWVWQFAAKAADSILLPGHTYINIHGEQLTVRAFKFYVSHLEVAGKDEVFHSLGDSTYLVDLADTTSQNIVLQQAVAQPAFVRFTIGVDSNKNTEGVQTGTLDPARGMFWTWNSGYIMARLEGRSPASGAPGHYCTYDVGGFREGECSNRTVTLQLPAIAGDHIVIAADALRFFYGAHTVTIAQHPVCHEPGALAMQLADNYAGMFYIAAER
ncbi:MbnP family protein [Deminuibacter soli]|uniref:MbnP family protein n=1 Tax=Deminuibacter soli TaxID=2291815 RepID=UPI001314B82D|nr:MbnP family protein [Deminuibacter soli]